MTKNLRKSPTDVIKRLVSLNLAFHNLNKAAEGKFGLSLVQYHLLSVLRDMPGCSALSLAEVAGVHPSTITQTLKRLQKKNAVFVAEDPKDSRKKLLTLTREGLELIRIFEDGVETLLGEGIPDKFVFSKT